MPAYSHCGHGHRGHSRGSGLSSRSLQVWRDAWISQASSGVGSIQVYTRDLSGLKRWESPNAYHGTDSNT